MRLWLLRNRLRALFGLPPLPPRNAEPVPPVPLVVVSLRGALPGALVRLLPGGLVLVVAGLVGADGGWWPVALLAGVLLVARPQAGVAAGVVGAAGVWLLARGDLLAVDPATGAVPGVWRLGGLVLAVHLLLVTVALAGNVSWRSVVEAGVLWRAARSVLAAQAVAQSAVLLVAWLRAGLEGQLEWLRGLAVVAVVGAVLLALPRHWLVPRPARPPAGPPPGWVPPEE